jgi:hypothetical protein
VVTVLLEWRLLKRPDPSRPSGRHSLEAPLAITTAHLSPVLSLLFGILILMFPRILNYLVGIYLILVGLLGLGILVLH